MLVISRAFSLELRHGLSSLLRKLSRKRGRVFVADPAALETSCSVILCRRSRATSTLLAAHSSSFGHHHLQALSCCPALLQMWRVFNVQLASQTMNPMQKIHPKICSEWLIIPACKSSLIKVLKVSLKRKQLFFNKDQGENIAVVTEHKAFHFVNSAKSCRKYRLKLR